MRESGFTVKSVSDHLSAGASILIISGERFIHECILSWASASGGTVNLTSAIDRAWRQPMEVTHSEPLISMKSFYSMGLNMVVLTICVVLLSIFQPALACQCPKSLATRALSFKKVELSQRRNQNLHKKNFSFRDSPRLSLTRRWQVSTGWKKWKPVKSRSSKRSLHVDRCFQHSALCGSFQALSASEIKLLVSLDAEPYAWKYVGIQVSKVWQFSPSIGFRKQFSVVWVSIGRDALNHFRDTVKILEPVDKGSLTDPMLDRVMDHLLSETVTR